MLSKRIDKQKEQSMMHLEKMIGKSPETTEFTKAKEKVKIAQLKNLSSAMARYIAQDGRVGFMLTLTFGKNFRVNFSKMHKRQIRTIASFQYQSCMLFIQKMRKSRRIKGDIRYMATMELQSDGNLHMHIFLSVLESDMFGLVEFVYDYKCRHREPFKVGDKLAYPIGRMHIGVSQRHKKRLMQKYPMQAHPAKSVPGKIEHFLSTLECREFYSGDWTVVEFYDESIIRERYNEKIVNYLTKTMDKKFQLPETVVKEGVGKCQISHDTKTLYDEDELSRQQLRFIRLVGRQVYTHSWLPFPFKLYQKNYRRLVAYKKAYTVYYNCIQDLIEGKLSIRGGDIIDVESGVNISKLKGEPHEQDDE